MSIKVEYRLSQAGLKAELAKGGVAPCLRAQTLVVDPPYPPAILAEATIDSQGQGELTLSDFRFRQVTPATCRVQGYRAAYTPSGRSVWHECHVAFEGVDHGNSQDYDHILTVEDVVAILHSRQQGLMMEKQASAAGALAKTRAQAQVDAEWPAFWQGVLEREAAEEANHKAKQAAISAVAAQRAAWIEPNGSSRLKKALAAGYDCQRLYLEERATMEMPGFTLAPNAKWEERVDPTEEALDLVASLTLAEGMTATVVWLTDDGKEADYDARFEPCEVVLVQGWLGKYDLIHIMPR
ncbi:MAG: hypothetical protein Q8O40_03870 [Chloroflexota bacterium]|nr:hypothetical protein [Chloroflexota bacterium]